MFTRQKLNKLLAKIRESKGRTRKLLFGHAPFDLETLHFIYGKSVYSPQRISHKTKLKLYEAIIYRILTEDTEEALRLWLEFAQKVHGFPEAGEGETSKKKSLSTSDRMWALWKEIPPNLRPKVHGMDWHKCNNCLETTSSLFGKCRRERCEFHSSPMHFIMKMLGSEYFSSEIAGNDPLYPYRIEIFSKLIKMVCEKESKPLPPLANSPLPNFKLSSPQFAHEMLFDNLPPYEVIKQLIRVGCPPTNYYEPLFLSVNDASLSQQINTLFLFGT